MAQHRQSQQAVLGLSASKALPAKIPDRKRRSNRKSTRGGRTESARMAETRIRRISPGKDTRPARRRTARIPALKGPKGLYRTGMAKQGWHHVETPRPCIRQLLYLRRVFLCGGGSGRMLFWVPDQNDALAARAFSPERAKRDTRAGCSPQEGRQRPPLAAQRAAIHPKNTLLRMEDSASCGTRPKALPLETAIF